MLLRVRFSKLLLLLLLLQPVLSRADETNPTPRPEPVLVSDAECKRSFRDMVRNFFRNLSREEVLTRREAIGHKKISQIFPESREIPAGQHKGKKVAVLHHRELAEYNRAFSDFLDYEARLHPDLKEDLQSFQNWLRAKPGNRGPFPELNPLEVERYKQEGLTFSDMFYDQFMVYKTTYFGDQKQSFWNWLKSLRPSSTRDLLASLRRVTGATFGYVSTGVIAGLVVTNTASISSFAQGATGGLIAPVINFLFGGSDTKKLGEQAVESLIGKVFDLFEGGREKYQESLNVILGARVNMDAIDSMSPSREVIRTEFASRDEEIGAELAKFGKVLDRADKDRHKKKLEYFRGMLPALTMAVNSWNAQRTELEKIKDDIEKRGYPATLWEQKEMKAIQDSISDSEKTIAEAIAVWKVYKYTIGKDHPLPDEIERSYLSLFGQYMRWMDLSEYKKAYSKVVIGYQDQLQSYYK